MKTIELREELHEFINKADERLLNLIYAMVQADMKEEDYPLSDAHKKILDERLTAHTSDPSAGSSWEEVKSRVRSRI